MKEIKIIYLLALLLGSAGYCSAQTRPNKTVQKFYSKNTTEALAKRKVRSARTAAISPAEENEKTLQQVRAGAQQRSSKQVSHPNNSLPTEQKKKLVDANVEKLRHLSNDHNNKKPTAGTTF